jgi:hypothetical protein
MNEQNCSIRGWALFCKLLLYVKLNFFFKFIHVKEHVLLIVIVSTESDWIMLGHINNIMNDQMTFFIIFFSTFALGGYHVLMTKR